ncbi:MAG: CUB domain-containing protein, partial [Paraglaciecola chathamensis]
MKSPLLSAIFLIVFLFPVSALANTMCTDLLSEEAVGDITDSGGENRDYSNFENCGFLIRPQSSGNIVLSFTDFQYESGYDTLTVYDGSDASAPQLGRFTGGDLPDSITSTSGAMFIVHN